MTLIMVIVKCHRRIKLSYTIDRAEKISVYFIATNLFLMKAPSFLQHSFKIINPVHLYGKYFLSAEKRVSVNFGPQLTHLHSLYGDNIIAISSMSSDVQVKPKKNDKGRMRATSSRCLITFLY